MPKSRFAIRWTAPAAAAVLSASSAFAQAPPANPNDVYDILNRTQQDFAPESRATFGPAGIDPAALPNNVDIVAVRRGLESATRDAIALYDSLNAQVRYIPAIRQHLPGVLNLRARAERLSRQMTTIEDLRRSIGELRLLDSDWREVSYYLKQLRLDRTSSELVARIDATDDGIGKLLQIGPSVDYQALVQKTSALRTSIDRLIEDIDYEFGRTPEGRQLILEGQRVQQHAAHLADTAFQQDSHEHLTADFRLFQQSWTPFVANLRKLSSRYVDRDVQQVAQVEREVSGLLWIEQTLDRQQLIYMTDQLTRDVDDFFDKAPLKLLIKLPDARMALSTADEFYGVFENFADCVNRGENQAELQDAFTYIDSAWKNFSRVYRPLNSSEAQQVINAIEKDVTLLREALLIQEGFNRTKAAEIAAFVENLAGYLERDTRSWLAKARPAYAAEAQRDVTDFRRRSRELHEALINGAKLADVRAMNDALFENWRRVYGHVIKCNTSERPTLASTSSQTTPALVELRSLLAR